MWVDKDTRSPETKARHERIAADAERNLCGHGLNKEEALELLKRAEPAIMEALSFAIMDKAWDIDQERGVFSAEFRRFAYDVEWELKQILLAAFRQWPVLMCGECGSLNPKKDCTQCGDGKAKQ